uniref:Gustatory receptor n=1 Tax=Acrobeloides nanus TaxID=290746 RepID=A0A914DV43_9BILA
MDHPSLRSDLQNAIFGPFYILAAATGQIVAPAKGGSKFLVILGLIPSLLSLIVLIARAIYMFYRNIQAGVMTQDWCYATCLNNLALTAAVACLILFGIKYKSFIPNFLDLLLIATRNKIPTLERRRRILISIGVVLIMASSIVYCIENIFSYKYFIVNGTIRNTSRFRNSMFGMQWLFPIDIAIIIWGALITSVALSITSCMNLGICTAYKEFNEEIKLLIQKGEIKNIVRLEDIESQIIDFIKAHRYLYETSGFVSGLAMLTFFAGLLINISAQIGLRTLTKNSSVIDIVLLSLWLAMSVSFWFYSILNETKEMFYLEKSLWINASSSIRDLAFSITDRLEKLIASSNTIGTSRSAFFILNLLLLIVPFVADILSVFVNR